MKPGLAYGLAVGKSAVDGKGCFATVRFPKRRKIAEYVGEKISRQETARRIRGRKRMRISAIDQYWNIDGSVGGNGTQYINHSCAPNCFTRTIHGHMLFFALRDIEPGEEITLDYIASYHSDQTRCRCGAPSCRGTINRLQKKKRRKKR